MPEHPCPLPKKYWWFHGRSWQCECGKEYWLMENARQILYDWEVDWVWIECNRIKLDFPKP